MEENSLELMELIDEFLRDSLELGEGEKVLCHICGERCTEAMLEVHLESHTDTPATTRSLLKCCCLFCSRMCSSSGDMNDHLSWHMRDVLVDLDFCEEFSKGFLDVTEVEGFFHTEGKSSEGKKTSPPQRSNEVTQCEICGKLLLKSSVGSHLRTRHCPEKPFECEKCGRKYKSRGSLKVHAEIHRDRKKSWICEKCGSSFYNAKSLLAHTRRLHGDEAEQKFICPVCGKTFRTANDVKYHREGVHLTLEKRFKCRMCCLSFKGLQGLHRHEAKHKIGEIFHYKCSFCDVKFSKEAPWKRHEEICSGQMKYECKYCRESFATYVRLRGHRRRVHQEKILKRRARK